MALSKVVLPLALLQYTMPIFWSSTPYDASHAYRMDLYKGNAIAYLGNDNVGYGFSVRCLQD